VAEVQDFARRRPGTFLVALAAAGFVAGRLGKGIATAQRADNGGEPSMGSTSTFAGMAQQQSGPSGRDGNGRW